MEKYAIIVCGACEKKAYICFTGFLTQENAEKKAFSRKILRKGYSKEDAG